MRKIAIALIVGLFSVPFVFSQVSDKISKVNAGTAKEGEPLTIRLDLLPSSTIERVEIAYRQFGERDFTRREMELTGNSAETTLPPEAILPPFIEYYFVLSFGESRNPETYPLENPEQQPLKSVVQSSSGQAGGIVVLSPDPGEKIQAGDVLISFSLSRFDSAIDKNSVKTYLDGVDLSENMLRSDDLFILKPENFSIFVNPGEHTVRIELFDSTGKSAAAHQWSFFVSGGTTHYTGQTQPKWRYGSSLQLETRQERIDQNASPFNRAAISAHGSYYDYRIRGNLYLTNEEKSYLQPQNRYFIGCESPWAALGYGDSYPLFPDLVMNGKRIRGFTGSLNLGKFNLDVAGGKIVRGIEGLASGPIADSSLVPEQEKDPTAAFVFLDSTAAGRRWIKLSPGTFDRSLFVIRTIFGKRNGSHLGFSFLKSSDDIHSIMYGIRPQENVLFGSDLFLTFDSRNIEVRGEIAFSATNKDISGGTFSDDDIDTIFQDDSESDRDRIRKIRDIFSGLITVNEYLVPLAMKNLPTLSYEGGLALNYFNNNLRFNYIRRGASYESFGQSYLRTDVAGFNISDRQRLCGGRIFLSGGFERLQDNTARTKGATTTSATANLSVSYYPKIRFPNVTVAYLHASNRDDGKSSDPFLAVDDKTNRVLLQFGKELIYGDKHNLNLSMSASIRNDNTSRDLDTRNTAVSISDYITFRIPLQAAAGLTFNSNKFISDITSHRSSDFSYTTLFSNAQYSLSGEKIRLNFLFSQVFGDIERTALGGGAQYYFLPNVSLRTELNLYLNKKMFDYTNTGTDIVWNLVLRAEI